MENIQNISKEIEEEANAACVNLLPAKSQERYSKTYKFFKDWCHEKNTDIITEEVLLAYFLGRSKILKSPSSLWCEYSMLKSTIFINDNQDISKYPKLKAFLKRKNDGYKPKTSSIFTREDMDKFLTEEHDDTYLLMKVVMIMGISGACRKDELCKMTTEDVEDKNSVIIIKIPDSKNGMQRSFTIINREEKHINFIEIIRKYINVRSKNAGIRRFFLKYHSGKCVNQPVGKNSFAKFPARIAEFLKLKNPTTYTGHSFRRTSATFLADTGIDVLGLNRHGGWKSTTVAESYVADSLRNKLDIADRILYNREISEQPASSSNSMMQFINNDEYEVNVNTGNSLTDENQDSLQTQNVEIKKNINSVSNKECNSIVRVDNCSNCSFTFNITK